MTTALYSFKIGPKMLNSGKPLCASSGWVSTEQRFLNPLGCAPEAVETPSPKAVILYLWRNFQNPTPIRGRRHLSNKAPKGHV